MGHYRCLSLHAGGQLVRPWPPYCRGLYSPQIATLGQLGQGLNMTGSISIALYQNLKKFPGDYDCSCGKKYGNHGGQKNSGEDADHSPLFATRTRLEIEKAQADDQWIITPHRRNLKVADVSLSESGHLVPYGLTSHIRQSWAQGRGFPHGLSPPENPAGFAVLREVPSWR